MNLLTNALIINYTIYSLEFQFKSKKVLEEIRGRAVALKQSQSLIFHASIYIFCDVRCTKWGNYYPENTSDTRGATWKR